MDNKKRERRIIEAIVCMPTAVCWLIGEYDRRLPYAWTADNLPSFASVRQNIGGGTELEFCQNERRNQTGVDDWLVFVADRPIATGWPEWTIDFDTPTAGRYICAGLTTAEQNWINTADSRFPIFAGPDDWMVGFVWSKNKISMYHNNHRLVDVISSTTMPSRIRMQFIVDIDGRVRCRWTPSDSETWRRWKSDTETTDMDGWITTDMDGWIGGMDGWNGGTASATNRLRLRPCIAIAGRTMVAVESSELSTDWPNDARNLVLLASSS